MYPDITRDDVFMLETKRLWLRWPRLADAQAIVRFAGDKRIADMAMISHPLTLREAEEFIFHARQSNANGTGMTMVITPKNKPNVVFGVVTIEAGSEGSVPQLGFWLAAQHWGHGYTSEAVQAMVDAFFIYTTEQELISSARVENEPSKRVLGKVGFIPYGDGLLEKKNRLPNTGGDVEYSQHGDFVEANYFSMDRRIWGKDLPWMHPEAMKAALITAAA
ncbi:GNAT family N-acetyltransferase [Microvirga sp. W0021]|uniref:GNAT family N-acetyltransferase n=1 Tax=Hohaiivirga grylli TaxID=3133970 RepID=A0ABV0BFI5_9HYPH